MKWNEASVSKTYKFMNNFFQIIFSVFLACTAAVQIYEPSSQSYSTQTKHTTVHSGASLVSHITPIASVHVPLAAVHAPASSYSTVSFGQSSIKTAPVVVQSSPVYHAAPVYHAIPVVHSAPIVHTVSIKQQDDEKYVRTFSHFNQY